MTDQQTADARKVAFKTKLLIEQIGLAAGVASKCAPMIHMIKSSDRPGRPHRLQLTDGGWVEIDPITRHVRSFGSGRMKKDVMLELWADDPSVDDVSPLQPTATVAAPGAPRRAAPVLSDQQVKTLAERWRERGFDDLIEDERGVWVALQDGTRLYDIGNRVTVYGPVTDEALRAMVTKAKDEWGGRHVLSGSWTDRDRERMWLESMRQGVTMLDYEPSAKLLARWDAEQAASGRSTGQTLRPGDAPATASSGPVPDISSGGNYELEPDTPGEPDLSAFDKKAADLDRRQADLEARHRATIKERVDALMREQHLGYREAQDQAFRERDEQRQEEERLTEARAILARARELAIEKGLDYKSAVALAKAEHLAEQGHDYEPRARLRR